MRKAILHALASSTYTTTPFLMVMVIPVWEDTPWYSAAIRSQINLETLIQTPAGHMRFVRAHKQTDSDTTSLPLAKWPVELVLISSEERRNQFVNMYRINQILAPALRIACHMTTGQLRFFPNTRAEEGRPYTPPGGTAYKTLPMLPGSNLPTHPNFGKDKAHRNPPKIDPSSYALKTIPRHTLPHRPIHLVELCGGIA
jgi:hypothetical protein